MSIGDRAPSESIIPDQAKAYVAHVQPEAE
jgi:hypothetical protein